MLELKKISKLFGRIPAVNNVSLSLERGKLVTFVGPSGCGKTTLLRMISGFTEPTQGKIYLDGEDITYLRPNRRDTAMVFQNYALFPHMTVAQNIGFGLGIMKKSKKEIDHEVSRLLELVQLEGLGSRKPQQLSGGQQQRVALARALSLHPKILLLDEPTRGMDYYAKRHLKAILMAWRDLGKTIVVATHDIEFAAILADRVTILETGSIRYSGTPITAFTKFPGFRTQTAQLFPGTNWISPEDVQYPKDN